MTKGKRVVAWVLALAVLAGLGGCAKPAEKEDGNWFEDSVIVNTALTRKTLSENPVVSTDEYYSTILDWVDLYIRGNYNASAWGTTFSEKHYTLKMVSGEKSFFTIIFCETNFQSDVTPEGFESANGSYQLRIQMVIKTGKNYYEGPFTLIGFVTNQERQIIEPRELYDFIKGVPDYKDTDFITPEPMKLIQLAALGYDFTDTKMDDESGLSVVNLRSLTGGLEVDDFTFLPGDLLAILTVNPEVQNEKLLMVFKAEELRLLYQKTFSYPAGDYPAGGHVEFYNINGTLVLEQKLGDEIYKYFIPTMSGVLETPEPKRTYRLSDTAFIVDEKNCLYLEQNGVRKLLLEGIYEEDSTDWENYNFFCRISDTRFIYEVYGYEWYVECGIFDISTDEKTVLTHKNAPLLNMVTYKDGKAILVADTWCGPEYESYGPYLYDESTRALIDLDLLNIIPDETMVEPRLCLFGNTLVLFMEDRPFSTFNLYDLPSKAYILQFNILNAQKNAMNRSHYYSGLYSTENYIWFNSASDFPEDYLLRIPKKR